MTGAEIPYVDDKPFRHVTSTREVVLGIIDRIEKQGHFQGATDDQPDALRGGPCCIVANPAYEFAPDPLRQEAWKAVIDYVDGLDDGRGVFEWNDTSPTDVVLAGLREVADRLEDE